MAVPEFPAPVPITPVLPRQPEEVMSITRTLWPFSVLLLGFTLLTTAVQAQSPVIPMKQRVLDAHRSVLPVPDARSVGERFSQWKQSNDVLARRGELRGRGLRIDQILGYDRLAARTADLHVHWDEQGTPIYVSGNPLQRSRSMAYAGNPHRATVQSCFTAFSDVLGISDGAETFAFTRMQRDESGRLHLRYRQLRSGVPVYGREVICGIRPNGDMDLLIGRFTPDSRPTEGQFTLDAGNAIAAAGEAVAERSTGADASVPPALLPGDGIPRAERCWFDDGSRLLAAYSVELHPNLLERWQVMVSASDGRIIRAFNAVCADGPEKATATDLHGQSRSIDTYLHQGSY